MWLQFFQRLYHERAVRDKQEATYNGTDEAIILRANEHYCQRDIDKNNRANHEIPRTLAARLESGKKSYRPDRPND